MRWGVPWQDDSDDAEKWQALQCVKEMATRHLGKPLDGGRIRKDEKPRYREVLEPMILESFSSSTLKKALEGGFFGRRRLNKLVSTILASADSDQDFAFSTMHTAWGLVDIIPDIAYSEGEPDFAPAMEALTEYMRHADIVERADHRENNPNEQDIDLSSLIRSVEAYLKSGFGWFLEIQPDRDALFAVRLESERSQARYSVLRTSANGYSICCTGFDEKIRI